jgi:hypothetical protein
LNTYAIWVDLAAGASDLEFVAALEAYLRYLRDDGRLSRWRIRRRKLGFGPHELGEFFIEIEFTDLEQLDRAFARVATREPAIEALHAAVFSRVTNFRSALYRDFPDPMRYQAGIS